MTSAHRSYRGTAPTARRDRWTAGWAKVVAVLALLSLLVPGGYGAVLALEDLSAQGEKFDGLGLALGGVVVGGVLLVAVPWALFLRYGGRAAFVVGAVLTVLTWLWLLQMGIL
ncbi:hypothetical protein [Ornithinimicrobium cerasi]|uniref:hypothetical protein n=1 Tax=Ornithinimicrobium cerasi TaxID=2248773 RepID=UPI000EFDEBB1|nr:hypothetical protein [Ornithinimicrobium cerasi]